MILKIFPIANVMTNPTMFSSSIMFPLHQLFRAEGTEWVGRITACVSAQCSELHEI